jgi:hypothetical protein
MIFRLIVTTVMLGAFVGAADAASYCLPKNGKDRIAKQGICASGYFASGDCCEAFHTDTPRAFHRIEGKACSSGSFASGGACKSFR